MVGAPDNSNSVLNADNSVSYPGGSSNFNERTGTYTSDNGSIVPTNNTGSYGPGITQEGAPGYLQNVGQFLTGSNNPLTNSMFLPAVAQAIQQWHNADQYKQLGMDAANRADPFGKYRGFYGDRLQQLYNDPSQIENTPGYKFALNQAMNATSSKLASQGMLGSSQMQNALASEASGLAQQTWNQERNALMQMAGSQFDPANAGRFMMQGGQLAVDAQNGALAALFAPFGAGVNGRNGTGGSVGNGGGNGMKVNPQNAMQRLTAAGMNPQTAADLMRRFINDPSGVSQGDLELMRNLGIYDDSGNGGVDIAPGGYDSSGYGGWGTASGDPTLSGINFGGNFSPFDFNDVTGQTGFDSSNYIPSDGDMSGFQTPTSDLFGPDSGGMSFSDFLSS